MLHFGSGRNGYSEGRRSCFAKVELSSGLTCRLKNFQDNAAACQTTFY